MISLDDFNWVRRRNNFPTEAHPNGIECPECGKELWDSYPLVTLTSDPPQKNIHCIECDYRGFRLA